MLGERHPDTITSLNNLASVYDNQGRYAEAEPLFAQALALAREVLGERHPYTISSLNNLAFVYGRQSRYAEAEPLYAQALQLRREVQGERHPDTITGLNNLAGVYDNQGRYAAAEPLYAQALRLRREVLGERHPDTISSLNNLATAYDRQGRYAAAEPLYAQALQLRREVLGERHPDTITSLNNLAFLYGRQSRYAEAEPLWTQALALSREVLGADHPLTLLIHGNMAYLLARQGMARATERGRGARLSGRRGAALVELRLMAPQRLSRLGRELYGTADATLRHGLLNAEADFQNLVLSVALAENGPAGARLAGDVLLRWKRLIAAEDAFVARFARNDGDPAIRDLAARVLVLRRQLAALARSGNIGEARKTLTELETRENELGRRSRAIENRLRVANATLGQVQDAMHPGDVLLEFRRYRPLFGSQAGTGERWALLVVRGREAEPQLFDAGSVSDSIAAIGKLLTERPGSGGNAAAAALFGQLFGKLPAKVLSGRRVWIAADGQLALLPFARLRLADGRLWVSVASLRFLETGRELQPRYAEPKPGSGLMAFGGIDFGGTPPPVAPPAPANEPGIITAALQGGLPTQHTTEILRSAGLVFGPLPETGEEVGYLQSLYLSLRPREVAPRVLRDTGASKGALNNLLNQHVPPRVLHLATHGFFLPDQKSDRAAAAESRGGACRCQCGSGRDFVCDRGAGAGPGRDGTGGALGLRDRPRQYRLCGRCGRPGAGVPHRWGTLGPGEPAQGGRPRRTGVHERVLRDLAGTAAQRPGRRPAGRATRLGRQPGPDPRRPSQLGTMGPRRRLMR